MERISADPNSLQSPDFSTQEWEAARDEIIAGNPNTDHVNAAALLAVGWKATNNEQKRRWTIQQAADLQEEQARTDQQQADKTQDEEDRERLKTDAADEERKKYKQKFIPIPDRPLSVDFVIHSIADSARTTLRKGDLVELYFCTPLGIQAALSNPKRMLEASAIGQDEDGNLTLTSKAALQAVKGLTQDDDLTMEQFCLATPIFLQQAALAGWPEDRIQMFAQFWDALQNHQWRWHHDPLRTRALIKYQAVQRRRWHVAMQTPGQGYSLALINEAILGQTYDELYSEERLQKDRARDALPYREFPPPSRAHAATTTDELPLRPPPFHPPPHYAPRPRPNTASRHCVPALRPRHCVPDTAPLTPRPAPSRAAPGLRARLRPAPRNSRRVPSGPATPLRPTASLPHRPPALRELLPPTR